MPNSESSRRGLYGSARASALASVDRRYNSNALIVADLSNDASYAEALLQTFGPRVIGLQISHHGDGMNPDRRPVGHDLGISCAMPASAARHPHLERASLCASPLEAR